MAACPIWSQLLTEELTKEYFVSLRNFISEERRTKIIYPDGNNLFSAFNTPYEDIRIVIAGREPYCDGLSNGYAYSSIAERTPVLGAIFEAIATDWYHSKPEHVKDAFKSNNLACWSQQGIFLYNSLLSVEKDKPLSHLGKGWEKFTKEVYLKLNNHPRPLVFMFWGANMELAQYITDKKHFVLKAMSPIGSKHFSLTEKFIALQKPQKVVDWRTFIV
jgi:uracil-DNA glycosylase